MTLAADPMDLWGALVTLFAMLGWLGVVTVAAVAALVARSIVAGQRRTRVSDATLFAYDHPAVVHHEVPDRGLP